MSDRPNANPRFGDTVFVLFSVVQMADGWLTYTGIRVYGVAIEANPLISWSTVAFGAPAAIFGAKAFAIMCGALLHLRAWHYTVGLLTIGYLAAAISPWIHILWR